MSSTYLIEEIYEREIKLAAEMEDEELEADLKDLLITSNASIQQYN